MLVTWFIVSRVGLGLDELRSLDSEVWTPHWPVLAVASLVLAGGYFASAALWGRIVRDLGGPELGPRRTVPLFMIANLGRYVPGKVWQIAGLAALARARGVPVGIATGAAVLGQGIALLAAATLGVIAMLGSPRPYPAWGMVALTVILGGVALSAVPRVFHAAVRAWFRITRTEPPESLEPRRGAQWYALYLLNWGVYALAFWILTRSFGLEGAALPVASAFAASYVLGYAMLFAPAGLGPREGFLIAFLTPHFGAAPAGMIAVVARLWTTVVEVVPAAAFWMLRPDRVGGAVDPSRADDHRMPSSGGPQERPLSRGPTDE